MESIKKVAAIVSDIANASAEQATGIEQVNKALTQMDEVTQQNSALVEENAATAKTLEQQARAMDEQVAFFQIGAADRSHSSAVRTAALAPMQRKAAPAIKARGNTSGAKPVRGATQGALAVKDDPDWQEF